MTKPRSVLMAFAIFIAFAVSQHSSAHQIANAWTSAKNRAADLVYHDHDRTLYCGCPYVSHNDGDGSGSLDMDDCDMEPLEKYRANATRIEWEHIVPAALMSTREFSCWRDSRQFKRCVDANEKTRDCCELISNGARAMLYDLHNLVPAVGQINQYRGNDRYGMVDAGSPHDRWNNCEVRHRGGAAGSHRFEPEDCTKGDVARVWLYMHQRYGVRIPDLELEMFKAWSELDPVSPWESERDRRIADIQGNHNPFVVDVEPSEDGACEWDPDVQ